MSTCSITKNFVDKLTISNGKNQQLTYDNKLNGFGIRITRNGVKAFFVERRVNGRVKRRTVGQYPTLTVDQARKEAQRLLGEMTLGIDPAVSKKELQARSKTLLEVYKDYRKARKGLKPKTLDDYDILMAKAFHDWQSKPISYITKDMVAHKHSELGKKSFARANLAMRFLRALFNFAKGEYEDCNGKSIIIENPVSRLSHTRAWFNVPRKTSVIKMHQLAAWYQAVMSIESTDPNSTAVVIRDFLLLVLFTGLRRNEAMTLKKGNVDLVAKTLTIIDTKNHRPHSLPLSSFLLDLLQRRIAATTSEYIFPGALKAKHIIEPRKQMKKVTEISEVQFTLHDLRRTFITLAESLDIPSYALKFLLNHKTSNDVTAGYIIFDVERLRVPMQKITDHILSIVYNHHHKAGD